MYSGQSEAEYEKLGKFLESQNIKTEDDLEALYKRLLSAENANNVSYDKDGKPILDEEGGCLITPNAGFVVKTQV